MLSVSSIQARIDVVAWSGLVSKKAVPLDFSHAVLTVFEADRLLSYSAFYFGRVGIFMSLFVARV